jgi:hypothetical protein
MSTSKNKITLEFDESFYEQRLIEILNDTKLTAFQFGLIKDYFKIAYRQGENKGINVMLRRYGYVDKKTLQSKV